MSGRLFGRPVQIIRTLRRLLAHLSPDLLASAEAVMALPLEWLWPSPGPKDVDLGPR